MNHRPRSLLVTAIATALITAGLVLGATADMAWLILFGLGAFGPSLLRLFGWLDDLDEFQRLAAQRAGHHAFLAGGIFLCAIAVIRNWGHANLDNDQYPASLVLAVMTVTWLMSRLVGYLGARNAAKWVLVAFGTFWLGFVVLSHGGWDMFPEVLVTAPFLVLATTSRRWPRATGVGLLAAAIGAWFLFQGARAFRGDHGAMAVVIVFDVPLLVMGLSLLATPSDEPEPAPA